jgi:hypothetical protein
MRLISSLCSKYNKSKIFPEDGFTLALLVRVQADSGITEFRQVREELPSSIITMFILQRGLMVLAAAAIALHINVPILEAVDTTCWLCGPAASTN